MIALHLLFVWTSDQSEKTNKKGEDVDADDENVGEEDSQFMKLAKKLTVKTLQRKGQFDRDRDIPNSPWIFLSCSNKQVTETCRSV